jgi:hypothetical protein
MKLGILVHPFYMGMGSYKMNKHKPYHIYL